MWENKRIIQSKKGLVMKIKNKHIYYIIGLAIAFITMIPPLPNVLKYLLGLIPVLAFGADLTLSYMQELYSKNYINRFLTGIVVGLGLIVTGKIAYAAVTFIFFSMSEFYFNMISDKMTGRVEDFARINAPYAKALINGKASRISVSSVIPGQTLVLSDGDIIPCDCSVINGEAELDYTNIFGKGELRTAKAGSPCFSGGIVQSGNLTVRALKSAKDSLASLINYRTKKAQAPSKLQKKIRGWTKLFEPAVYCIAFLIFIILLIVTKDFPLAVNQTSVILVASPVIGIVNIIPIMNRNALLCARRRGAIFTDIEALWQCGKLQTVSFNCPVSNDVLAKVEETGVVPATGGYTEQDAVVYRDNARLEADSNPSFKLALGFFSSKAHATALDANPLRTAGVIRTGRNYRNVFLQNIICLGVEKLALVALVFLLNITPAAAIVIEFAAWVLCLFNATKEI